MIVSITAVDGFTLSIVDKLNEFVEVNKHAALIPDVIIQDINRHIERHPLLDHIRSNNSNQSLIAFSVSLRQVNQCFNHNRIVIAVELLS